MKRFAPAPHSRLGNTSETIADADKGGAKRVADGKPKNKSIFAFAKIHQANKRFLRFIKKFAVAGAIVVKENVDFVGATTGRPRFVKEIFGLPFAVLLHEKNGQPMVAPTGDNALRHRCDGGRQEAHQYSRRGCVGVKKGTSKTRCQK